MVNCIIGRMQTGFEPLQPPNQPTNSASLAGVAVSVTAPPRGKSEAQSGGHAIP
jgi:hypothetical protein